MKKHNIPDEIAALIPTYLSGNATDIQVVTLEKWVLADKENRSAFIEIKKSWLLSSTLNAKNELDINKEWRALNKQLSTASKVVSLDQRRSSRRNWISIAAGLAILVAGVIWFYNPFANDATLAYIAEDVQREETLADGSTVHLNQSSEFYFNNGDTRNGQLTGDAFFDIKRDEEHPFEILAGNMNIKVLGTSFYVDARPNEDNSQVIVNSGKVSVKARGQEVILEKGESATFNKTTKKLVKTKNEDSNFLSWTNNTINFNETNLKEVVFVLNRHYNANIIIENKLLNSCKITAQYEDKSLEAVLKIIEATLGIEAIVNNKSILLKGSDC